METVHVDGNGNPPVFVPRVNAKWLDGKTFNDVVKAVGLGTEDLTMLTTINKENFVGSINEINAKEYLYSEGIDYSEPLETIPAGALSGLYGYTISGAYVGAEEPEDKNIIWVNTADEDIGALLKTSLIKEIRSAMSEFGNKIDRISYAIDKELDSGYFNGVLPGSDGVNTSGIDDGASGTVGTILIKRGLKEDIENLQRGELGFCIDTEELYIGNGGSLRLLARVGDAGGGDSGNVTGEYIELISPNASKFRVGATDDGLLQIRNSIADTASVPLPKDASRYNGLLINKVYGGGQSTKNTTPVSHSFIELYNGTENPINLKGLSVQTSSYSGSWKVIPLVGIVKPYSSFLIRGAEHSDPYRVATRIKILDYDMSCDVSLSDKGIKVYLRVGAEDCPFINPADVDGTSTKEVGYINMFCAGGSLPTESIDAYERNGTSSYNYLNLNNKDVILKRRYSSSLSYPFANTGSSADDIEAINVWESDLSVYSPRPSNYGQWTLYYDQIKHDARVPNMINICFGEDGNTSRTFTWQSVLTDKGFLKYRKLGNQKWILVPSTRKFASHLDIDVTIHSVIIHDLEFGTYEYMAGEEGCWSDIEELEIKDSTGQSASFSFAWVTDQQGWDKEEYLAWKKANEYIIKNEDLDFFVNTGDISQNANRAFEWRSYYEYAKEMTRTKVHMTCVGNNDLIDKLDSKAFTYYSTCENSTMPSVYSINYGNLHLIGLNSNIITGYTNTEDQIAWLRTDMAKPENKKRWTIVIMHESPYTIVKSAKLKPFIDVFYELKIDLVLCGHHHCYSLSKRMGAQGLNESNSIDVPDGVYYVMSPSTGTKTSGKQKIDPNNRDWVAQHTIEGVPCYSMLDITYNKITLRMYRMMNILPFIDNVNTEVFVENLDKNYGIGKNEWFSITKE